MGYNTNYMGVIEVDPPMSEELCAALRAFAEERHGGNTEVYEGFPDFWCKWEPTRNRDGIEWNGIEKFYYGPEWMQLIIDEILAPEGHTCNGSMMAQGETPGDVWKLVVKDNKVSTVRPAWPEED